MRVDKRGRNVTANHKAAGTAGEKADRQKERGGSKRELNLKGEFAFDEL